MLVSSKNRTRERVCDAAADCRFQLEALDGLLLAVLREMKILGGEIRTYAPFLPVTIASTSTSRVSV
jgi:hypothetical protein